MKSQHSKWIALLIVLTAPLLSVIDVFIVNVAIPSIKQGVHATDGEVQLVIAGYLLGYATFLITAGRAGDFFGRKRVFFLGYAVLYRYVRSLRSFAGGMAAQCHALLSGCKRRGHDAAGYSIYTGAFH